jgi:uncharacterized membrane protein
MNRLLRILKHRWLDESDTARALGPEALRRIEARVAASEKRHRGEIRVCVEAGLPWSYLWRNANARERAITMFGKLRVWDTEHNSGVLIYLLLAEHRIEIVADRGLNQHIDASQWAQVMDTMRSEFRKGQFEHGLELAIDAVDELLGLHFAIDATQANPNELPNAPYVR